MNEFFRGWKRKVGCVTLLLACVFMAGWARSYRIDDYFMKGAGRRIDGPKHHFDLWQVILADGTLFVGKLCYQSDNPAEFNITEQNYRYPRWRVDSDAGFSIGNPKFEWRVLGFGFYRFLASTNPNILSYRFLIPYWSVTIPLTALSAFLLFKKPKTSTQPKTAQPVQGEGGRATS